MRAPSSNLAGGYLQRKRSIGLQYINHFAFLISPRYSIILLINVEYNLLLTEILAIYVYAIIKVNFKILQHNSHQACISSIYTVS